MARAAGFVLQKTTGMTYNLLTQKYKLRNDLDVNYLMYLTKD